MERATVVSADGHASMPPERWPEYLEKKYHDYLPQLTVENEVQTRILWLLNDLVMSEEASAVFDTDGAYQSKRWAGLWDRDVRLGEMDREGIAAELVYFGDFRTPDLFFNVTNGTYPLDVIDAGVRAYDRWAADAFGPAHDRLLLSGGVGTYVDVEASIAELEWIAERGFVGTYAPGFVGYPHLPPLYDEFWEPIWAAYDRLGLVPIVHGGYGFEPGLTHKIIRETDARVRARGGSDMDLIIELTGGLFNDEGFFKDVRCRRGMWQMMLGGVFDRHPGLKLMMTEVRGDWVPDTLRQLDAAYEEHRADIPAKRKPSEYWDSNCLAGLSFMHLCEVEHRDEIGTDTIAFGRDYPHSEGTWPNTIDFLKLLFRDVPMEDIRKMLGENTIRFFGLDPVPLAKIAERIGPDLAEITDPNAEVAPKLVEHLEIRTGVLKPFEGDTGLHRHVEMLQEDLAGVGAR